MEKAIPRFEDRPYMTLRGEMHKWLQMFADETFDSIVTDPPAGISFMGKKWDGNHGHRDKWIRNMTANFAECLRVAKPGAHAIVWALPRTSHWTMTALEDAGWEIRDVVTHLFGQGFPKSHNVSKAIDKKLGAEREVVGAHPNPAKNKKHATVFSDDNYDWQKADGVDITAPATTEAEQWDGWGTALKPAAEYWILARKPFKGAVADNVLEHGTGAINIDDCRVASDFSEYPDSWFNSGKGKGKPWHGSEYQEQRSVGERLKNGRWPANVVLSHHPDCRQVGTTTTQGRVINRFTDGAKPFGNGAGHPYESERMPDDVVAVYECHEDCPVRLLDAQSGTSKSRKGLPRKSQVAGNGYGMTHTGSEYDDIGGASRFFYVAKASKREKNHGLPDGVKNTHPTTKPVELMRYLVRLVTPPNGIVLDPFCGSGTTGVAAILEGFRALLIDLDEDDGYLEIARHRLRAALEEVGS